MNFEARSRAVIVTKNIDTFIKDCVFEKNSSFVARYETAVGVVF